MFNRNIKKSLSILFDSKWYNLFGSLSIQIQVKAMITYKVRPKAWFLNAGILIMVQCDSLKMFSLNICLVMTNGIVHYHHSVV